MKKIDTKCALCGIDLIQVHHRTKYCKECRILVKKEDEREKQKVHEARRMIYLSLPVEEQLKAIDEARKEIMKQLIKNE